MEKEITGVMVYYYIVCKKKLWYFYHEISMEHTNDNVYIGKLVDEESYKREAKHINIDNVINIDFIRTKKILHEVKKSKSIEEASILQVKYYLYYLKKKGVIDIKAKIDYPLLKQSVDIEIDEDDEKYIQETLDKIKEIVSLKYPPKTDKKKICKSCAYYDLYFI